MAPKLSDSVVKLSILVISTLSLTMLLRLTYISDGVNVMLDDCEELKFTNWTKYLPGLNHEDEKRIKHLFEMNHHSKDLSYVRELFFMYIYRPLQSYCKVGKFFGGEFAAHWCFDGHKYVCLDDFYYRVINKECLIYSFGINHDWTFEENMISLGCTIRAFDPTVDGLDKPNSDLVTFSQIGISHANGTIPGIGKVMTLKETMELMGDSGKTISYLKVDVEGAELTAMKEWIDSGVLDLVDQIGIEIHTGRGFIQENHYMATLLRMMKVFQQLHRLGFRHISTSLNDCTGKTADIFQEYTPFVEVVFYKVPELAKASGSL